LRCLEFAIQKQAFDASAALLAVKFQRVLTLYNNERIGPILERFFDWPNGNDSAPLRAHIGCAIIHSISNSGQVERQSQLVERCEALAEGDDEATIDVRFCKSNIYKVKGEYPEAIAEMEWVLARTDTNDDHLMANRLYRQGLNYGCLNDRDKTFYYFSNALPYARRAQDVNMIIRLLFDLGSEYAHLKDGDKAIECFVEAETLCESVGSRKLEGLTRWQHGDALIDLNQPAEALELLKQSIKLVYEGNFPAAEKWIFIKAAQAAHECGFSVLSAKLLGKGVHVREEEKRTLAVYETNYVESLTEKLRSKLGDHEFKRHKFEGIQSDWQTLWSEFDSLNSTGR
ncbi:MAG TPA: tetratricopeptide repeat protein, partial [Fimbriimonas sp.]|nr:tetratricopeptide repeat protein [Fimbriimonas sp.]